MIIQVVAAIFMLVIMIGFPIAFLGYPETVQKHVVGYMERTGFNRIYPTGLLRGPGYLLSIQAAGFLFLLFDLFLVYVAVVNLWHNPDLPFSPYK